MFELVIRPDTSPVLASLSLAQLPSDSQVEQRRRGRFAHGKPTFADIIDTFLVPGINALLTSLNHKLITTVEFVFQPAGLQNANQSAFLKSPLLSDRAEEAVKRLCALLLAFKYYCYSYKDASLKHFYNVHLIFCIY